MNTTTEQTKEHFEKCYSGSTIQLTRRLYRTLKNKEFAVSFQENES